MSSTKLYIILFVIADIRENKVFIKGINYILLSQNKYDYSIKLGEIASITNGTNDVQDAVTENKKGLYPFYDRSEHVKYLDSYYIDDEAIIYPGEGSEFYPRYYNGKFALHQRCYAIYNISKEFMPKYIFYYMYNLNNYFVRNAVGSTVPSLRLDVFKRVKIPFLPLSKQKAICEVLDSLSQKMLTEQKLYLIYNYQKKFLLQNLFI